MTYQFYCYNLLNLISLEGTILINVGDLLEILSGGNYPATRHRVKIPQVILNFLNFYYIETVFNKFKAETCLVNHKNKI